MSVERARALYIGKEGGARLNCCQAIIAAFKERFSLDDDAVIAFAGYGKGAAPGGMCGALHAAKHILKAGNHDMIGKCEAELLFHAGSTKCEEIRSLKRLSCVGCAEKIARFLEGI